jgi:hypothetical protein
VDWIYLAQDRGWWRTLVNMTINLSVSIKIREFLDKLSDCWIPKKNFSPWG